MRWFHPEKTSFFRRGICLAWLLFCISTGMVSGQDDVYNQPEADTTVVIIEHDTIAENVHSPHRATIYSMILPGLGQAYNRKYWKIPIVYAGFGALYYFIQFNNTEYQLYKDAYSHASQNPDGTEDPINDYEALYDVDFLKSARDYYRRNRDLTYILTGVWYFLNVVDATVDAHLFTWEVDEDLTLRIEPDMIQSSMIGFQPAGGFRLTLRF
jgi:hypothetical protein